MSVSRSETYCLFVNFIIIEYDAARTNYKMFAWATATRVRLLPYFYVWAPARKYSIHLLIRIHKTRSHTHTQEHCKKSEVHCSIIHLNTLKIQCHACANFSAYKSCLYAFIARTHMHTQTQSVWSNRLFWSVDNAYIEYIYSRGKYQNKLFTKISKYLLDFLQWNLFADCSQNQDVANISTLNHVTNIVKSTFCNIWNIRKITSL